MLIRQSASSSKYSASAHSRHRAMKVGLACLALLGIGLSGCALQPIHRQQIADRVDPISIQNQAQYRADVDECAHYANESLKHSRDKAVTNAVVGALIGAAVGQAIGGGRRWNDTPALRNTGAAYGALVGGSQATVEGANRADSIVLNCLLHRGYALLY